MTTHVTTVKQGDPDAPNPDCIEALGKSTMTTNGENGIGNEITLVTQTTVTSQIAIAYGEDGKEVARDSRETTSVFTTTTAVVKDKFGGWLGVVWYLRLIPRL